MRDRDLYDSTIALVASMNKPNTLRDVRVPMMALLSEYPEEQQDVLALLLFNLSKGKISIETLKDGVVDMISNKADKLRTIGEYEEEFSRLYKMADNEILRNDQMWNYGGLKNLEVTMLCLALKRHFDQMPTGSKIIDMVKLIDDMKTIIGGHKNLYWYYAYKWNDFGLINYGTSIKYVWFELDAFKDPGNERYLKVLDAVTRKEEADEK